MKIKFLAAAAVSGIFLTACAGGVNANKSLGTADATASIAADAKIEPAKTDAAKAKLDSAKALQQSGEEEQAAALAEESALEYRLAIATAERDEVKKEDERVEKELRGDVERKLIYQSILDKETKKEGAAK